MHIIDRIINFSNKIKNLEKLNNIETKTNLILPFLNILGYPIFEQDILQFDKNNFEKDLYLNKENQNILYIECLPYTKSENFNKVESKKLFKHDAIFHIFTNGIKYKIYSRTEKENQFNTKPFYELDILDMKKDDLSLLNDISYNNFNIMSFFDYSLKNTIHLKILDILESEYLVPSSNVSEYILSKVFPDTIITKEKQEIYSPYITQAFNSYMDRKQDVFNYRTIERKTITRLEPASNYNT